MSVWVRVLGSRSPTSLDSAALLASTRSRLERVARYYGETVAPELAASIAVRAPIGDDGDGELRFSAGHVPVRRVSDPEARAELCAEIEDEIAGWEDDEPGLEEVREALSRTTEVLLLEVDVDLTEGAAWPCVVALALALAEATSGIVAIDGEGYFGPKPGDFEHLLDSD
jgi:hypothetical protein